MIKIAANIVRRANSEELYHFRNNLEQQYFRKCLNYFDASKEYQYVKTDNCATNTQEDSEFVLFGTRYSIVNSNFPLYSITECRFVEHGDSENVTLSILSEKWETKHKIDIIVNRKALVTFIEKYVKENY